MISLAVTTLMQRIGKVGNAVNAKILTGLAALAPISSQEDCKSILEVFVKTSTDAIWQDDQTLFEVVSIPEDFVPDGLLNL